jgi:hypothetical protein
MSAADAPTQYIQLAFGIEHHLPGYIDSYFGPAEWQTRGESGDAPSIQALEDLADSFGRSLAADPALSADRRAYLEAEWIAMRTTLQILQGKSPDIVQEVKLLYGVTPQWVDERRFEQAHRLLGEILPGSEPLAERVQSFRERSRIPAETAVAILQRLAETFRGRTRRQFDLPAEESFEISTVRDQPWRAYNHYQGGRKSHIELNLDHPMEIWDLPTLAAHEAYPGHHSEYVLKETGLYAGAGQLEQSIRLSNTPSALISEGIAKNALRVIAAEAEITDLLLDCYAQAGLPRSDAGRAAAFIEASQLLESVTDNQILLLYRDRAPDADVTAYGMRYALTSAEDEALYLRFYKDPLSRSYTYNYTLGRQLVADYLDRAADRQRAFHRLLSQPTTPAQLQAPHPNASV